MSNPNPKIENPEQFFDVSEDFPLYDCISTNQSKLSTSHAQHSSTAALRRRQVPRREFSNPNSKNLRRKPRFRTGFEENEVKNGPLEFKNFNNVVDEKLEDSTITSVDDNEEVGDSVESNRLDDCFPSSSSSGFLVYLADLIVRAIGFQVNLFFGVVSFPVLVLYHCYMLCVDPFGVLRYLSGYCKGKVSQLWERVGCVVYGLLEGKNSVGKLALRLAMGFFWSVYVLVMMGGLFVASLVFGAFVMRFLVEEPVQVKEVLNFDYTKSSPVAYVPLVSCAGVGSDGSCKEKSETGKALAPKVIPHNHKTQVTVSLTLPESEYNKNLGIFQIKVDFLSSCGRTLTSSSHPCMLQFKSEPIRLIWALFQAVPLVAGYVSESQTLEVKFKGFTEGDVPTSCLRVILQQRAEFLPDAGIPEIYDAFLVVESELPLLSRIIWYWRKTIFVWVSMTSFVMELLFTLLCCRPIIIPNVRLRNDFASTSVDENSHLLQS